LYIYTSEAFVDNAKERGQDISETAVKELQVAADQRADELTRLDPSLLSAFKKVSQLDPSMLDSVREASRVQVEPTLLSEALKEATEGSSAEELDEASD
jgi:hypothetical protein